jgi:hypothetical protein
MLESFFAYLYTLKPVLRTLKYDVSLNLNKYKCLNNKERAANCAMMIHLGFRQAIPLTGLIRSQPQKNLWLFIGARHVPVSLVKVTEQCQFVYLPRVM